MQTDLKKVAHLRPIGGTPPTPPPGPRQRRTGLVAVLVIAVLAGTAGGWYYLRPGDRATTTSTPQLLRLGFSPGSSYGFRVEANTTTTMEIRGVSRDFSTGVDGTLRIGTEKVRQAWADGHGDLSVLSFVANGAPAPDAFRVRHPMRLNVRGPVTKGMSFQTDEGLPLLMLPMVTPVLPARLVAPGEVWTEEATFWQDESNSTADVFTELVSYETVGGIRYAVVHGTVTVKLPQDSELGWGEMTADVTARLDPETRFLLGSTGTVHIDVRTEAPAQAPVNRVHLIADSTFTLSPLG